MDRVAGGFTHGLFLFTDIEGSRRLWESAPDAMRVAMARHDEIVRGAIEPHGGYVFATSGDGFAAAFARPPDAIAAAEAAQAALGTEVWPEGAVLRVRMGLHTGVVDERDGNYLGPAVNRAARIMAAGHAGRCSSRTRPRRCWAERDWWIWVSTSSPGWPRPSGSTRRARAPSRRCVRKGWSLESAGGTVGVRGPGAGAVRPSPAAEGAGGGASVQGWLH
jgi:hypothetical protein